MSDPTPKIIQLEVLPSVQWTNEGESSYLEHHLLGLDDHGVVWKRGKDGWEPHTAALTGAP